MSLPYFLDFGWQVDIISVVQYQSDINKDNLLCDSLPADFRHFEVNALSKKYTSKLGLGSIAIRALHFIKEQGNKLLRKEKFDLIYFSTTQFPVCVLGRYWKKKFGIPYVIDMQDPWHSEYYQDKPKHERPAKYWFSYRLNKYLEPIAMKSVDGLISVSEAYINDLKSRYPIIKNIPSSVITFGAFEKDFEIAEKHGTELKPGFTKKEHELSIAYVGRGGKDMWPAVQLFFDAFKEGLKRKPYIFSLFKVHFIGTSYASAGAGKQTIQPLAREMGIGDYVEEQTDRISFYRTLRTLKYADALFIPGSDDPRYTASKIYPYLMAERPLISVFHQASSAAKIIKDCEMGLSLTFDMDREVIKENIINYLVSVANRTAEVKPPKQEVFEKYSAKNMTKMQVDLFEKVLATRQARRKR